jgi:hypothetical protein
MDELMQPQDPLDELLAPHPAAPPSAEVFARTVRVLRRQRCLRRVRGVAVLAATYAAGLLTVLAYQPPTVGPAPLAEVRPVEPPSLTGEAPLPTQEELPAVNGAAAAVQLYHQAGDLFLSEDDPHEALRCYSNALDAGKSEDLEVSTQDSWLLLAIKQARKKERARWGK